MRIPGSFKTFLHSVVGIIIAMLVIYFTLNWLRTNGPTVVQGPAGALGSAVSGRAFNF
jgi:hypothetical protein